LFSAARWIAFLLPLTVLPGCNQINAQLDKLGAFASGESSGEGGSDLLGVLGGEEGSGERSKKASYYQYVDENGSVRFVKGLHEVPAKFRDQVGHVEFDRKERKPGAGNTANARRRTYANAYAAAGPEITVFSTSWCGWCRKTIAWLDDQDIQYTNKDIEADTDHRDEIVRLSGGTSVPVVVIDGEVVRGFNPGRMKQLIGSS